MLKRRLSFIFLLIPIFILAIPWGAATADAGGTAWSAWFSTGTISTLTAENVTQYDAELKGHVEWKNRHAGVDLVRDAHFKYMDLTDSSNGWQSVTVTPVPTKGGDFKVHIKGLTPGHTYQYYTYLAMTESGSHNDSANTVKFTTLAGNGTAWTSYSSNGIITTSAAANVTQYSADLKGHVEWQNRNAMIDLVRDTHFKYQDLTDGSQGLLSATVTPVPTGGGDFTVHLSGLAPGHNYQFYAYLAMTISGSHDDSAHTMKFTTQSGRGTTWTSYSSNGIVVTLPAENVTQYGADLKGHVEWRDRNAMIDLVRDAHFWYRDASNWQAGDRSVAVTPVPTSGGDFTAHLSGLVPGHTYSFYVYVNMTMSGGHYDYDGTGQFTTQPGQAGSWEPINQFSCSSDGIIAPLPVQNIGQYSADLSCHVEWQNYSNIVYPDSITDLGFYYSEGSLTGRTAEALGTNNVIPLHLHGGDYTVHLHGLTPGHTYTCYPWVAMFGTDSSFMSQAPSLTFTTLAGTGTAWQDNSSLGVISTLAARDVTDSTSVLCGHAEWQNQNYKRDLILEACFKYQDLTSGSQDFKTVTVTPVPTNGGDFSAKVSGLIKGHTYQFWPHVTMTMSGRYEDSAHPFLFTAGSGSTLTITANMPTGVVGQAFSSSLKASGGDGHYTWNGKVTAWDGKITPGDGLAVYPNGIVCGVPITATPVSPQAVPVQVWVTVRDASGNSGSATYSISVIDKLRITTSSLPSSLIGNAYQTPDAKTVTLTAGGGQGRCTWSGTITPDNGLTFNADGSITGTPQSVLSSAVKATVKDEKGNQATANFNINIFNKLIITSVNLPTGLTGTAYKTRDDKTVTLGANGGDGHYTWSGTITPSNGLRLNTDGSITGTPEAAHSSTVNAAVSDGSGNKANASFKINIFDKLKVSSTTLPVGMTGIAYHTQDKKTVTLNASGGDGHYTWSGTFTPTNGTLQLSTDGKITGTPSTATGGTPLTLSAVVKDSSGNSDSANFEMYINNPLPAGVVDQSYDMSLVGIGGDGHYVWSGTVAPANGTLKITPDGKIAGTPATATGAAPLTATIIVNDGSGNSGGSAMQLKINSKPAVPVSITTTSLPGGVVGQSYHASLGAAGGDGHYTWSGTVTPANGLILKTDGSISGIPQAALPTTVDATVVDGGGSRTSVKLTFQPKERITSSLADITIDMDNYSQLKCFFNVYPADARVTATTSNSGTVDCSLNGSAGSYWLTLNSGIANDNTATIIVTVSKTGLDSVTRSLTIHLPQVICGGGGGSALTPAIAEFTVDKGGVPYSSTLTALSHPGAAAYAIYVQNSAFTIPNVGDTPIAGATAYNTGNDINGVTAGEHLGIYALDASGKIIAFTDHVLTDGEIRGD
ncbi:MAG TPA: hypothetical protein VN426_05265 [Syntrophomonadaceae bacterium]|nr:hypothetical protein [Syntrophomonadaceae bacterium]